MLPGPAVTYYDKVLAAMAASLAGGVLAGVLTETSLRLALFGGASIATAFLYHALFRNPPTPELSRHAKAAAVVWHAFLAVLLAATVL